jgi:hypothetical protein
MQYLFTYPNDGRERSKLRVDYRLFEVLHVVFDVFPASGNDGVAFVLQPRFLDFSTPGILGIQLTVVFYGPPVRDITMHFFGRIRDDGDEDAGGEGAAVLVTVMRRPSGTCRMTASTSSAGASTTLSPGLAPMAFSAR